MALTNFLSRLTGVISNKSHVNGSSVSWHNDNVAPDGVRSAERVRRVGFLVRRGDVSRYTGDLELVAMDMEGVLVLPRVAPRRRVSSRTRGESEREALEPSKESAHSVSVIIDDHEINYLAFLENHGVSLRSIRVGVGGIDTHRKLSKEGRSVGHDEGL